MINLLMLISQELSLIPIYDVAGTFKIKFNNYTIWDRFDAQTPGYNN